MDPATGQVTRFLEKPAPEDTTSRRACPAIYALRTSCLPLVAQLAAAPSSQQCRELGPGSLLATLVPGVRIIGRPIDARFDVNSLARYRDTLRHFEATVDSNLHTLATPGAPGGVAGAIVSRSYARAGLMGNPSDGFNGKCVAILLKNFYAEVTLRPSARLVLVPHPEFDPTEFASLGALLIETEANGYYGGVRLVRAACKRFAALAEEAGIPLAGNFTATYATNVPRQVGLSGSSAIITATVRALLSFYGVTPSDLGMTQAQMPQVILDIEMQELGITAGLQDRVVQWYKGAVHMDFSKEVMLAQGHGEYTPLDPETLPPLYVAYNTRLLGDSGKVHSDVKRRWLEGDSGIEEGMRELAGLADSARDALASRDYPALAAAMRSNFACRRRLYGDEVVGARNIAMVEIAAEHGFAAKFTGSGGAVICLRDSSITDADGKLLSLDLTAAEEQSVRRIFQSQGFEFVRAVIHARTDADGGRDDTGCTGGVASAEGESTSLSLHGAVLQID